MCYWCCDFYTKCSHSPLYLQDLCSRVTIAAVFDAIDATKQDIARSANARVFPSRSSGNAVPLSRNFTTQYPHAASSPTFSPTSTGRDEVYAAESSRTGQACNQIIYTSHQVIDDLCPDCRGLQVPVGPLRTPSETVEQHERRGGGSRIRQRRHSQQQQQQQSGQQYRVQEQYSQHPQQRRRSDLTQQNLHQDQHLPQGLERLFMTPEDMHATNWAAYYQSEESQNQINYDLMSRIMAMSEKTQYPVEQRTEYIPAFEESSRHTGSHEYSAETSGQQQQQQQYPPQLLQQPQPQPQQQSRHVQYSSPAQQYRTISQPLLPKPPQHRYLKRRYSGIVSPPTLAYIPPPSIPPPPILFSPPELNPQYYNLQYHRQRYNPKQQYQQPQPQHDRHPHYSNIPYAGSQIHGLDIPTNPFGSPIPHEPFPLPTPPSTVPPPVPLHAPQPVPPPISTSRLYAQTSNRRVLDHELAKARDREAMRRRERERKLEVEAELRKVAVEQLTRRHVEWEKERELVEYYAGMGYRVDAEQLRQLGLLQEPATAAMEEKSDSRGTSSSGLWGL